MSGSCLRKPTATSLALNEPASRQAFVDTPQKPMSSSPVTKTVVVQHAQGLHARPAELVAREAMRFSSRVEIVRDSQRIDAKSILNILTLGATQGTQLSLEAVGEDAAQAVQALALLVEGEFEEPAADDATTEGAPAPNQSTAE